MFLSKPHRITFLIPALAEVRAGQGCLLGQVNGRDAARKRVVASCSRSEIGSTVFLLVALVSMIRGWRETKKLGIAFELRSSYASSRQGGEYAEACRIETQLSCYIPYITVTCTLLIQLILRGRLSGRLSIFGTSLHS